MAYHSYKWELTLIEDKNADLLKVSKHTYKATAELHSCVSAHCHLSSTYAGTETTRIAVIYANRHVRSAEYRLPTKQNFVYLGTDRPLVEKATLLCYVQCASLANESKSTQGTGFRHRYSSLSWHLVRWRLCRFLTSPRAHGYQVLDSNCKDIHADNFRVASFSNWQNTVWLQI